MKLNKIVDACDFCKLFVFWSVIYKVMIQFKIYGGHLGRRLGFFKMLKGDRVSYSRFLERTHSRTF